MGLGGLKIGLSEHIWLPSALSRSELIWVWMLAPAGKMRPASQTGPKWFPKYDGLSSVHDLAATWMQMRYHRFSSSLESASGVLLRGLRFYLCTKSPDSRLAYGENTILALNKKRKLAFSYSQRNKQVSIWKPDITQSRVAEMYYCPLIVKGLLWHLWHYNESFNCRDGKRNPVAHPGIFRWVTSRLWWFEALSLTGILR